MEMHNVDIMEIHNVDINLTETELAKIIGLRDRLGMTDWDLDNFIFHLVLEGYGKLNQQINGGIDNV